MARLIDRLRTEQVTAVGKRMYTAESQALVSHLMDRAVPIVCDNVARHWSDQDLRVLFTEMPPLAPPFKLFWMEAREPRPGQEAIFESWGALCGVRDVESTEIWQGYDLRRVESTEALRAQGVRWVLNWTMFAELRPGVSRDALLGVGAKSSLWGPICGLVIKVGPNGEYIRDPAASRGRTRAELKFLDWLEKKTGEPSQANEFSIERLVDFGPEHQQLEMVTMTTAASYMRVLIYALGLMNCKNIKAVDVLPPAPLAKKRERRYGKPLVRYKVLTVGPLGGGSRRAVSCEEGSEMHKALHVCRGHFRTYTQDAPLFGKFTGTYWVAAHVRGSKSEGMIVKSYDVKDRRTQKEEA